MKRHGNTITLASKKIKAFYKLPHIYKSYEYIYYQFKIYRKLKVCVCVGGRDAIFTYMVSPVLAI